MSGATLKTAVSSSFRYVVVGKPNFNARGSLLLSSPGHLGGLGQDLGSREY